ncbi:MAG: hypothetical protein ACTS41_00425 [Candidatus Hodgkinia cicadicola]
MVRKAKPNGSNNQYGIKLIITLSIGTSNWVTFHSINRSELMLNQLVTIHLRMHAKVN